LQQHGGLGRSERERSFRHIQGTSFKKTIISPTSIYRCCELRLLPRSNNPAGNGGSGQFRSFHGSSIPLNGSVARIYPIPPGTDRNLAKPAAGYSHLIPASNAWHFPAGSGRKRCVSCGFQPENARKTASGIIVVGVYTHVAVSCIIM
jgi:hypothetical protein